MAEATERIGGPGTFPLQLLLSTFLALTKHSLLRLLLVAAAFGLGVIGMVACSSERKSFTGRAYENVVARDNGYFLAREKLRAVEEILYKGRVNDYNRILPLFPTLDDASVAKVTADLDDIIKKASIPIQHRPGSDWTDDSYIVIGKARYYKKEYEDAIKTFKYVNTTSQDANAKHQALIWLMRSFIATKEYESAGAVSDILDREQGTEQNARELFLTRAEYYLVTGDQKLAIDNLNKAIPYIEPKNEQSRTRYILAQLYQANGQDKEAYAELNKILKRNPPYELDFFSKLMLGQVSDLNTTDRARLNKYFAKLLKDTKNKEYRDKIYYEMARLDYRQQRYDDALALLQKSARTQSPNRAQKAYTYLLAGKIYYENLQKYRLAAAYYDSTVQNMPRESPDYVAIAERAAILKDFANQIGVVETQDSLQLLAKLDTAALRARLTHYAQAELDARQAAEAKLAAQQERAQRQQSSLSSAAATSALQSGNAAIDPTAFANASTGAQWYFDNPTALTTARADFIRRWGDRQLQDNWRVTSQASGSPVTNRGGNVPVSVAGAGTTNVNTPASGAAPAAATPAMQLQTLVAQYRQNIPLTAPQLQASNKQVEEASYALGGIYSQQLREPVRAIETYEGLIARFPQSSHSAEVFYSLYLLYKEQNEPAKAEVYAQRLRQAYPNSSYARLVADPEYLRRTSLANAKVSAMLDSAFAFYKKQEFTKSSAVLARTRKQYPENDLTDRVAFLNALLTIRTQPPSTAKAAVAKFYKDFPESPLANQAATLMETYKKYDQGQIFGALASNDKPVVSVFKPGEVDTRMRTLYAKPVLDPAPVAPTKPAPVTPPAPAPVTKPTGTAPASLPAVPAPTSTTTKPTTDSAGVAKTTSPAAPTVDPAKAARMAAAQARARGKKTPAPTKGTTAAPPSTDTAQPTSPVATTPVITPPAPNKAPSNSTTPAPTSAPNTAPVVTSPAPTKPATPYKTDLAAAHVVVLAFPKGAAPLADLPTQLSAYNNRYFKASNLQVQQQPLGDAFELVVVQSLPSAKVAQSYALKLRGPQSPLNRLRGAGYQTLVIGIDNLPLLLQSKDLEEYQRFYQQTYTK
ncbi:tetratricopeptide repeat protein [Hymenobacter sp. BT491]|uniref:type IX secretion system periplasmic lipoprotein PorW/SprE n=1 Tax=Hymenobacter sp. BT491 TaxID=2766779 RepID=UPI0016538262|nr:tetratricopeptide repeat protein [Hymenobacter sp. BT491]MBC6991466.1 hypothetical protein [Hymenobacter sp. BT491]